MMISLSIYTCINVILISLLQSVSCLRDKICPSFADVFLPGVPTEWCGVLIQPLISKLEDFLHRAQNGVCNASAMPCTNMIQGKDTLAVKDNNTEVT